MTETQVAPASEPALVGGLVIAAFPHPQGCRAYLVADPVSKEAIAIDPHLDLADEIEARLRTEGWRLPFVLDTHTHADHPSGSALLASRAGSARLAHRSAQHHGVTRALDEVETLRLGDVTLTARHAPGHTPDHVVLWTPAALFSGDSLFIGSVARTDFLGGDAKQLFATLQALLKDSTDATILYPGHDYGGRVRSTIGTERATNPWLKLTDPGDFAARLTKNPPPRPGTMDALLRMNRDGIPVADSISAGDAVDQVKAKAATVIDVRTGAEIEAEHVAGSRHVPLDQLGTRLDEVRATPAPRLLLCRTGRRAETARQMLSLAGIGALSVVEGGIEAYRTCGGATVTGKKSIPLERQARIAAGSLILVGLALGAWVHPGFLGISAFFAAGLVFSGITDWCGMALLLARMPWNRGSPKSMGAPAAGAGPCAAPSFDAPPAGGSCAASPDDTPAKR